MTKILRPGDWKEEHELRRDFDYTDEPGSGASFPCDAAGNLLPGMHPYAYDNFERCQELAQAARMVDLGVKDYVHRYYEPPVIECARCGHEVELYDAFLSTCGHCGADYNGGGQLLAPREQWGEETGETLTDMLNGEPR